MERKLIKFIKKERKRLGLTQLQCASKAGVSYKFMTTLEQGKQSLQMDKVNQVLGLFGAELGPVLKEKPTIEY